MIIFFCSIALIFLFLFSAFWSSAETALTSLSKYRIKKLIALNKKFAAALGQWLKAPYYLLTTVLVGNTINDLLISYLASILVFQIFNPFFNIIPREVFEFANWISTTFFLLIFGEVTPKVYSRRNPEKVTIFSLPILSRLTNITNFIVSPFIKITKILFPRLNLVPVGRLTCVSLEEVHGLISEANVTGALGKEASLMLERVLKLGNLKVSQIMTPINNVDAVSLSQDDEKFLDLVVETGRSRVPVYNVSINKIIGFIHTKDLLWCWKNNHGHFSREMIRPPYFVNMDKKVYELLKEFQSGKTHLAFVVDSFGNTAGLVTLEDVLEDIVGEILDEYDLKKQ